MLPAAGCTPGSVRSGGYAGMDGNGVERRRSRFGTDPHGRVQCQTRDMA
jgi:hypothetical protein